MVTALYILHVIVCLAMLPIILLQSGKGGGVSAVFGGGSSGNVFGSRGASTFLTRMTTGAAIVFMCTSMGLAYVSSKSSSVLDRVEVPEPTPSENLNANENAPAEANAPSKSGSAGGLQVEVEEPNEAAGSDDQKD